MSVQTVDFNSFSIFFINPFNTSTIILRSLALFLEYRYKKLDTYIKFVSYMKVDNVLRQ